MRESFGGTMIFWIVLFMFSIFITFTAIIVKYSRVYKIKNTVINYITKKEGIITHDDIDNKLKSMDYQEDGRYKICRYFPSDFGGYYYLELYSETGLPIIGGWVSFRTKIKGETKTIKFNVENTDLQTVGSSGRWFSGTDDQCFMCTFTQGDKSNCDIAEVE